MSSEKSIKISLFQKERRLDSQAIGAGVYIVELLKDDNPLSSASLYIGESVYMVKRCGEHLYDVFKDSKYFGLTDDNLSDEKLGLCFRVLEYLPDNVTKEERKEKEKGYIKKYKPLTQSPNSDQQIRNIEVKVSTVQNAIAELWKN